MRIGIRTSSVSSTPVDRTADSRRTTVEDVGVDHRCFDASMAQEFLDRSDIVPVFEEVGGEGMSERMASCPIGQIRFRDGVFHGFLNK